MRTHFSKLLLAVGILLSLSHGAYAAPPTDIQMLPPTDFSNNACNLSGKPGILYWDGVNPIRCIPGSSGDASGDITAAGTLTAGNLTTGEVTANSLLLSGATGVLNYNDADVLISLAAQSCGTNEALSISGGVATCVSILNLAQIGPSTFPDCGASAAITWNGANFSCAAIPAPTPPASANCASGFMTGISGGTTPTCAPAALASTSCTPGQYVTGVDSIGNPVCAAPFSCPSDGATYNVTYTAPSGTACTPLCPAETFCAGAPNMGPGCGSPGDEESVPNGYLGQIVTTPVNYYWDSTATLTGCACPTCTMAGWQPTAVGLDANMNCLPCP
jgi:hypothetical protein